MDFTVTRYTQLLQTLLARGYSFMTFEGYLSETQRLRDEETEGRGDEETERRRDLETEGLRDRETEGLRDEETERLKERRNVTDSRVTGKSAICSLQSAITNHPFTPCSMPHAPCSEPFVILRHDVDARPGYALRLARIEHALCIRGTYYFRTVPKYFDEAVIREISSLGHETGYHYETMAKGTGHRAQGTERRAQGMKYRAQGTERRAQGMEHGAQGTERRAQGKELGAQGDKRYAVTGNRSREAGIYASLQYSVISKLFAVLGRTLIKDLRLKIQDSSFPPIDTAYLLFKENLARIRAIVPVTTICPHGSPLSPSDNREIWTKYDYRDQKILGDATLDVDFSKVAYFTDTGRRWDGFRVSVRDKVGRRDEETEGRRDEETEGLRDIETKGQGDKETKGLRDGASQREGKSEITNHKSEFLNLQSAIRNPQSAIRNPQSAIITVPRAYHHTRDLIRAIEDGTFPAQAMITIHPQRWTDAFLPWLRELVWQNLKNQVKRIIVIHSH